jgi:hypothetical protein
MQLRKLPHAPHGTLPAASANCDEADLDHGGPAASVKVFAETLDTHAAAAAANAADADW